MIASYEGKILRSTSGWPMELIPDASGGTITYDGDYKIHTFNVSDNFVVMYGPLDASVLLVGGGGSSGGAYNSGSSGVSGGAGGGEVVIQNISFSSNQFITIGKGGLGVYGAGSQGGLTSIGSLVDASGGFGSSFANHDTTTIGAYSASGFAGGTSQNHYSGGGGGNSAVGSNGLSVPQRAGNGGAGTHSSISGVDTGYGGGGAGSGYAILEGGLGQDGGGNANSSASNNTGGGGGGQDGTKKIEGNNGGDGVVIIRYKYK